MAYADQTTGKNQRAAVMIAVALLQGAAIVALVNGLAVHFTKPAPMPNPEGKQIDMPVEPLPPPPKHDAPPKPDDRQITRPDTPFHLGDPVYDPPRTGDAQPFDPGPTTAADPPLPPQPPAFPPRAAAAVGRPGEWVTANDYPARDLREGNQGTTGFSLTIGASGRVTSCTVTRPSGFAGLDAATCSKLQTRARFTPARDGAGQPVTGEFSSQIRWVIPK